jgi:hypothetical protein
MVASLAVADAPHTGLIAGRVFDSKGGALSGVQVRLESERGVETVTSGDDGSFQFVLVVPGKYTLRADHPGFQPAAGEVTVSAGGRAEVELRLSEAMGAEIVVTDEAPLVNRFDTTGGGTVTGEELQTITGQARTYRSQLMYLSGVHNDAASDRYRGTLPSIQGAPGYGVRYFIDGLDVSPAVSGSTAGISLPSSTIAEVKLESSGADAELGRSSAPYVRAIVRSGTNQFHGNAQLTMYNLAWDAANRNVPTDRPDEMVGGFEATLGGPIVRDRLWFFLSFRDEEIPAHSVMADGISVVDRFGVRQTALLKLDWRPSQSHSLSAMYTDTPADFPWWGPSVYADLETVVRLRTGGDLTTARWSWVPRDDLLLTAHLGTTEASEDREPWVESMIDEGCAASQPCGNDWIYFSLDEGLLRNGMAFPTGVGRTGYPRDQTNISVEWFKGRHDLKAGIDHQQVSWDAYGVNVPQCFGWAFGEDAPGGYLGNLHPNPQARGVCTFYPTKDSWQQGWGPVSVGSRNTAFFIRDRFTSRKWTLNLGLRVDRQHHENDVGETTIDSTNRVPRLAASYDVLGDSELILSASAGRHVEHVQLGWSQIFNVTPTGRMHMERYRWNPQTRDYDLLVQVRDETSIRDIVRVEPWFRDELGQHLLRLFSVPKLGHTDSEENEVALSGQPGDELVPMAGHAEAPQVVESLPRRGFRIEGFDPRDEPFSVLERCLVMAEGLQRNTGVEQSPRELARPPEVAHSSTRASSSSKRPRPASAVLWQGYDHAMVAGDSRKDRRASSIAASNSPRLR